MHATLTIASAKELGRALRFFRNVRSLTLRDVGRSASLSPQYVQNIERGERITVSEDAYMRFAKALSIPDSVVLDLVLQAKIKSALEQRGLDPEVVSFVWRGIEQRLSERDIDLRTDIAKVVAGILAEPPVAVKVGDR